MDSGSSFDELPISRKKNPDRHSKQGGCNSQDSGDHHNGHGHSQERLHGPGTAALNEGQPSSQGGRGNMEHVEST